MWRKGIPFELLVAMKTGGATMKNSMVIPANRKALKFILIIKIEY